MEGDRECSLEGQERSSRLSDRLITHTKPGYSDKLGSKRLRLSEPCPWQQRRDEDDRGDACRPSHRYHLESQADVSSGLLRVVHALDFTIMPSSPRSSFPA